MLGRSGAFLRRPSSFALMVLLTTGADFGEDMRRTQPRSRVGEWCREEGEVQGSCMAGVGVDGRSGLKHSYIVPGQGR